MKRSNLFTQRTLNPERITGVSIALLSTSLDCESSDSTKKARPKRSVTRKTLVLKGPSYHRQKKSISAVRIRVWSLLELVTKPNGRIYSSTHSTEARIPKKVKSLILKKRSRTKWIFEGDYRKNCPSSSKLASKESSEPTNSKPTFDTRWSTNKNRVSNKYQSLRAELSVCNHAR